MAYTLNTAEYFHGATNDEIDFFYYGSTLKKHSIQFHNDLKLHLWEIKKVKLQIMISHQMLLTSTQRVLLHLLSDTWMKSYHFHQGFYENFIRALYKQDKKLKCCIIQS